MFQNSKFKMIHYSNAIIFNLNYIKIHIEKIVIGIQISRLSISKITTKMLLEE